MMTRNTLPIVGLLLLASSAAAQIKSSDAPISYEADTVEPNLIDKTVLATGNVVITQGDMRMRADTVRIEGVEGDTPRKITTNGHVVLDSPSGTIVGDTGVYDVAPRQIVFTGKVILTRDKNVLRGSVLTYSVATGQAKFTAPGARVQGLLAPPPGATP